MSISGLIPLPCFAGDVVPCKLLSAWLLAEVGPSVYLR
jgi:hypothetical protein